MRSMSQIRLASALILLVAANLFWAGQGVAVKLLEGKLDPLAIALLPFYCVTAVGLCLLVGNRSFIPRCALAWRFRGEFLVAGICGQFLAQVGMTLGVSWSLASNGAVISLMIPILSALIATWLLGERLTTLRICSLLLGIAGVILLSPVPHFNASGAVVHPLAGDLFITAGCLGSAFYNVYSKRLLDRFSDLEILFFSYLATAAVGLPMLVLFAPHCLAELSRFRASNWVAFGYLAIILYGVSMALFLRALRKVDAIVASASLYLVPLFGVAMAFAILKERLLPHAIMGSIIVLLATWVLFQFDTQSECT
jgi:drug/metabolite transporter (DMT)-like permease